MFFGENSARAEKCPQSIALLNVWQTSAMLSSSRSLKFALSEYSAKEAVESCCLGRCPLSPSPILFIPFYLPKFSHNFHPRRRTEREERKAAEQLAFQTSRIQQRSFFLPDSNSMSGKSNIKKFETYFVFGSSRLSRRDKRIIHLRKKLERYLLALLEFLTF